MIDDQSTVSADAGKLPLASVSNNIKTAIRIRTFS
jgi:hypothetical protein